MLEAGLALVREVKRGTNSLYAYNEELVRQLVKETQYFYDEGRKTYDETGQTTKQIVIHCSLKRNLRCLLAYHYQRLKLINQPETRVLENMSKSEIDYAASRESIYADYFLNYDLIDFNRTSPPTDLYIQVRVIKECGTVQTENGSVTLNAHTLHYLKRSDVTHLVKQGYLKEC